MATSLLYNEAKISLFLDSFQLVVIFSLLAKPSRSKKCLCTAVPLDSRMLLFSLAHIYKKRKAKPNHCGNEPVIHDFLLRYSFNYYFLSFFSSAAFLLWCLSPHLKTNIFSHKNYKFKLKFRGSALKKLTDSYISNHLRNYSCNVSW